MLGAQRSARTVGKTVLANSKLIKKKKLFWLSQTTAN